MITCRSFQDGASLAPLPLSEMLKADWLHLCDPSPEEIASVQAAFGLPPAYLAAVLDYNERPRLEYEGDTLLVILRAPVEDDKSLQRPLSTCPVAFILRENLLVTVCLRSKTSGKLLDANIAHAAGRKPVMLMLFLFMRICGAYISHLKILDDFVSSVENILQESMHNKELLRLLHVDKTLIYYLTALKGNQGVLEKLRNGAVRSAAPAEKALLDDVLIENKQATDMAEIYTGIIGSIGDTFSAMVSNNLNKVMKILTGLTIVFLAPTIISSLYGMNVPLPGENKPYSFAVLSFLCLVITIAVYRLLKKKDWM